MIPNSSMVGNIQPGVAPTPGAPGTPAIQGISSFLQGSPAGVSQNPPQLLPERLTQQMQQQVQPQQPQQRPQLSPAQMQQFQQRIGGLHPETMNALRNIPPAAMQQLHSAGIIHPGVMDHLNGGALGGGRMGPMTGNAR
jgi:hypothetical protein